MSNSKQLHAPVPHGICRECALDPQHTFLDSETGLLFSYCQHHKTGGYLPTTMPRPMWSLLTPIEREEWAEIVTVSKSEAQRAHTQRQQRH